MTTDEFIEKANKIHNNKYKYPDTYINTKTKIKIICPEHGEFFQTPNKHFIGQGCPICNGGVKMTTEEFIEKANKIHNNKYKYPDTYINSKTKIKIICPEHGEFFQMPNNHLQQNRCPKCVGKNIMTDEFIEKANKVHNNKYKYPEDYSTMKTKIEIICSLHGVFKQTPEKHILGQGCPKCGNIKKRILILKKINNNLKNGYQITPNFNPKACKIFDKISEKKNVHIQHAMNGGEYYIKELGYWIDGYDIENNIVYEYDEKYHESKKQKEKDLIRENEIKSFLKCKFIRIKEKVDY